MNPKLEKYRIERDKNANRILKLQERNEQLDKQIAELESLELHALLRGANMSYQDLTTYIQTMAGTQAPPEATQEEKDNYEIEDEEKGSTAREAVD